jgi:putative phosphonate metabolism protein
LKSPRYAIYFVPAADTALYRLGATALGYDCFAGADIPTFDALPVDAGAWRELTAEPRRYGFHATLKAPFGLARERSETELVAAFERFARDLDAFPTIDPEVRLLQRFVAIVPATENPALRALAAAGVTHFDDFRAPLTEADRDRRLAAHLTAQQIAHVERWGNPYVFDAFRFHMTLTGALAPDRQAPMLSYLRERFSRCCGERPIPIDRLALLRQDSPNARFVVIAYASIGPAVDLTDVEAFR